MVLTARSYWLLLLGTAIALALAGVGQGETALKLVAIYDLVLLGLAALDSFRTHSQRLTLTRSLEARLSIGRDNPITLTVTTHNTPARFQIQDHHPTTALTVTGLPLTDSLPAHTTQTYRYSVHPSRRGVLHWGDLQLRQCSPWGLVWHSWKVAQPAQTQVYPDLVGLRELSIRLTLQSAGSLRKQRRWGMGTEFAELRDYGAGDDLRLMDWKATARRGQPLVRVLEPEQEQTLVILLDRGRLMTAQVQGMQRFDWAINAALALALAGLHRGDRVGLGVFDRSVHTWIPPQRGQSHLSTLIEAITPLEAVLEEPDYVGAVTTVLRHQTRRALVVILTDLVDAIASSELLAALARLSPRYLPFGVALRDPLMDQQAMAAAATVPAAFNRAVALDLLAQRRLAFAQVKQQGALVLDAPAPQIQTDLVDAYLRLKARNRL